MGVRKMYKFLSDLNLVKIYPNLTIYTNTQRKDIEKNNLDNKIIIIGIDFWLYAHKFTYSCGDMITGFWNQIIRLLSHRIIPLYIYDGRPPYEKDYVVQQRKKKKENLEIKLNNICNEIILDSQENDNSDMDDHLEELEKQKNKIKKSIIHIKKHDIDIMKEFFDTLHIPYLNAIGEADSLCAKLYKNGCITSCLSDDMDMLAIGCKKTIKFKEGKILEFDLDYILSKLEISYDQFVELCLMFGCDYIKLPFKLDIHVSYELIKTYGTIENILNEANHETFNRQNEKCKIFIENYNNAKNLLIMSSTNEQISDDFIPKIDKDHQIDPFVVLHYLKTYGQTDYVNENMDKILNSIDYVNLHISNNMFDNVNNRMTHG